MGLVYPKITPALKERQDKKKTVLYSSNNKHLMKMKVRKTLAEAGFVTETKKWFYTLPARFLKFLKKIQFKAPQNALLITVQRESDFILFLTCNKIKKIKNSDWYLISMFFKREK